jgi:predicted lipoprotein with Yx(FWY)xxD motif
MAAGIRGPVWLALFAASVVIAACAAPGASTPPATATQPTTAPVATAAGAGATIAVATVGEFGAVVTGAGGLSLYLFTNDQGGTSACSGDCVGTWPPLKVASASALTAGTGVTGALGTITRDDGSLQVTLNGLPLYYYAGDSKAGEANGQGLFDKWYLVSGAGTAVTEDPGGAESPGASKCTGPTCY